MQYFAKVNTAGPKTGFISVGEVLTRAQVEALGELKLAELVAAQVLGELPDEPKQVKTSADTQDDGNDVPPAPGDDGDDEEEADIENENDDEELPELEIEDELVEDRPDESPVDIPRKGGRRKAK